MDFSAEMLAKIRLARTPGVGPLRWRTLMQKFGTALRACDAMADDARVKLCSVDAVNRECESLLAARGTLLVWGEKDYPHLLCNLEDAPVVLSVLGDVLRVHDLQVGVVGNRNASHAGMVWTEALSATLAARGVTVTSGLARGIDTAAHTGALPHHARTLAVVAGGVNHIYPPENKTLRARMIAEGGAVLSEQPWGTAPAAGLFPRRNRLIAGLSVGVVVAEATRHSGSLITAEHALTYGRDVWAVPGSPTDPRASGPNWLLKQGATLIETADDVLATLPSLDKVRRHDALRSVQARTLPLLETPLAVHAAHHTVDVVREGDDVSADLRVLSALSRTPVDVDGLVRTLAMPEAELMGLLTEMELDGSAARTPDGRWVRG